MHGVHGVQLVILFVYFSIGLQYYLLFMLFFVFLLLLIVDYYLLSYNSGALMSE